uniref:Uncharacterized protein n=1 Tax=viral metagenome TaxID=1070528 RepID=A0A6C0JVG8_9ZZZZ
MAAAPTDEPVYYRIDEITKDCCVFRHSFCEIIPKDKIDEYMDRLFEKLVRENPPDRCSLGIKPEEHSKNPEAVSYCHCHRPPRITRSADGSEITVRDGLGDITLYKAVPVRIVSDFDSSVLY